jgi:ribosomal-protein-alanine N-acetyltransferase
MELEDIPQVSAIEREAFPPPWPPTNFRRDLTINTSTHYLVACKELDHYTRLNIERTDPCGDARSSQSMFETIKANVRRFFLEEPCQETSNHLILGFAAVWFLADEAHLANIAVRSAYQRQGVGEHLLLSVLKTAIDHNARFITLEVRASNTAAQALYSKCGFIEVGSRPGYYTDNKEDAVLMTIDGITSIPFLNEFTRLTQDFAQKPGGQSIL